MDGGGVKLRPVTLLDLGNDIFIAILARLSDAALANLHAVARALLAHPLIAEEWRARCEREWPSTRLLAAVEAGRALDARALFARRARARLPALWGAHSRGLAPPRGCAKPVQLVALVDVHVQGRAVACALVPGAWGTVRAVQCAPFELALEPENEPTLAEAMMDAWESAQLNGAHAGAEPSAADAPAARGLLLVEQRRAWAAVQALSSLRITADAQKDLYPMLPVLLIKAATQDKLDGRDVYACPVYKTQSRGSTYVFTVGLRTKAPSSKWILAGVCMLLDVVE